MTTAGLHCHHKIAGVLYMRAMGEECVCVFSANPELQHTSFDVACRLVTRTTLFTEIALNPNPLWLLLSTSPHFLSPLLLSWNTSLF